MGVLAQGSRWCVPWPEEGASTSPARSLGHVLGTRSRFHRKEKNFLSFAMKLIIMLMHQTAIVAFKNTEEQEGEGGLPTHSQKKKVSISMLTQTRQQRLCKIACLIVIYCIHTTVSCSSAR